MVYNYTIFHFYHAIADSSKALIVGHNDDCLTVFIAHIEEQLMQLFFVFGVEAAAGFIC